MRSRIRQHFPDAYITTRNAKNLYVADFSERTQKARGVEIHSSIPSTPGYEDRDMDCVCISNPFSKGIEFNVFDDHQFKDEHGKDIRHCECCIYPETNDDYSWVMMLEIKDCKPKNISDYRKDVIVQIVSTTEIFRKKNIITTQKVYGTVSFPRSKVSFNSTIFGMPPEYKKLKQKHGILFCAANNIEILDDSKIKFFE